MAETSDFLNKVVWRPLRGLGVTSFHIDVTCNNCSASLPRLAEISDGGNRFGLNPTLNCIFKDTIEDTGSPARAWQALLTLVFQMAYYDWLPTFDALTNATTSSMIACQTPQHFNGFGVVVLNLAVHLFIFCVCRLDVLFRNAVLEAWTSLAGCRAAQS